MFSLCYWACRKQSDLSTNNIEFNSMFILKRFLLLPNYIHNISLFKYSAYLLLTNSIPFFRFHVILHLHLCCLSGITFGTVIWRLLQKPLVILKFNFACRSYSYRGSSFAHTLTYIFTGSNRSLTKQNLLIMMLSKINVASVGCPPYGSTEFAPAPSSNLIPSFQFQFNLKILHSMYFLR